MYDKAVLIELVRGHALQFGDFTLASGKKASFYLDCRRVTLDSRGASVIADGLLELCATRPHDVVGGMELGAVPIVAAMLCRATGREPALRGFVVRKERKAIEACRAHGMLVERVVAIVDRLEGGAEAFRAVGCDFHPLLTLRDFGLGDAPRAKE